MHNITRRIISITTTKTCMKKISYCDFVTFTELFSPSTMGNPNVISTPI